MEENSLSMTESSSPLSEPSTLRSSQTAINGIKLVVLTLAVSFGIFMNVLDVSITNVAIPAIAGDMGVSADEGTWVITAFAVCTAIVLPITGWLARCFGEVRVFVGSTLLFTIVSILCGLSTSFSMLVFFRAVQGLVAGPMIPLSQSLLLKNYPKDKQGLATGLWAMTAVAAPVLGPIFGGYITDHWSWPWIFYINLPIGIFCVCFTWQILRHRETEITKSRIDIMGLIFLVLGVASLQILLDNGKDLDWFNSQIMITLAIIAVISLTFLVVWELTEEHPIIDFTLFKQRNFTIGVTILTLAYLMYFGSVVILPLWLQTQMNYTPTWAGLVTAPMGIMPLLLSPVIGYLCNKLDLRILITLSFLMFASCCFWLGSFDTNVNMNEIAWARFCQGMGAPGFFIPLTLLLLSGLPDKDIASAAGLSTFLRILGGSFGTSIYITLWDRRETVHQSQLVEKIPLYNSQLQQTLTHLHQLGFSDKSSYAIVDKLVINQSYMLATNDIFWISGVIYLGLMVMTWLARPGAVTQKRQIVID